MIVSGAEDCKYKVLHCFLHAILELAPDKYPLGRCGIPSVGFCILQKPLSLQSRLLHGHHPAIFLLLVPSTLYFFATKLDGPTLEIAPTLDRSWTLTGDYLLCLCANHVRAKRSLLFYAGLVTVLTWQELGQMARLCLGKLLIAH